MRILRYVPAVCVIVLCGCLEHQVRTTVSVDGSCERVIRVPADSMTVPHSPFPLMTSEGWDTTWRPAQGGKGVVLELSKHFARLEDLAGEYGPSADSTHLHVEVAVERSFRWFYTYYHYREVFHRLTPFTDVPPTTVLTEDEIARYGRGERNAQLNQKAELWLARSLYEVLFRSLNAGLAADPETARMLERQKEAVFQSIVKIGPDSTLRDFGEVIAEQTSLRGRTIPIFTGSKITDEGLAAFVELLGTVAGIPRTSLLEMSARAAWRAWNAAVERSVLMQGVFVNSVSLPGLIVETNSPIAEEHVLTWKFDGEQYSMTDYVMEAESRVENLWAFGITITVALVLGGIILYGRRSP